MATEEITLEEIGEISNRPSRLKEKPPKPPEEDPVPLKDLETHPQFLNLSIKGQVKAYDRWRRQALDFLDDPDEKAQIDLLVRARVQEKLASRGIVGEAAQSMGQRFLSGKADITRSINGTVAQMARIVATDLAVNFPGTNEEETTIARANQRWIREIDEQLDDLRGELKSEFDKPGKGNNRAPEIIKSMRALEEKKKPLEAVLNPILEKTKEEGKAAGFVTAFAGKQQLAADEAKLSMDKLRNRFRKSDKFTEEHPVIDAVASGVGDLPAMISLAMLRAPGMATLAMQMGQRAEEEAREIHPDLTEGEAFAIRSVSGATQAGLERIGIDAALGLVFGKAFGLTGGQIATRIKRAAIGGTAEGLTEPAQSILNGEIIQAVTGEEVDTIFTKEAFKDRLVDAFAGLFLGAGVGGLSGKTFQPKEPAVPEDRPPMADPEGTQTAPLLTPEEAAAPGRASDPAGTPPSEAPPLTTEETEGPLGLSQSTDGKKNALVQFQSDRDKSLFDAYKRFANAKSTPEDLDLIKEAMESGIDVQAFGRAVQARIDGAEANAIISAPPRPKLSQELQEAARKAEEETPELATDETAPSEPDTEQPSPPAETGMQRSEELAIPFSEPTGPPLEPREVFRQVRKAVEGVPNVRTRIIERKKKGSGVTFGEGGNVTFTITPSDIQGKGDDPRFVMDEEVTHLAEVLGARDEWEAGGKKGPFPEFLNKRAREHAAGIDKELLDLRSADRKIAARALVESIRAYSRAGTDQKNIDFKKLEQIAETGSVADVLASARENGVAGSDASIYSEWLRQTDQLNRTRTTTEQAGETDAGVFARLTDLVEAIREAIRQAVAWIDRGRSVLRKSPTFTGDIAAITRKRQELSLPALSRPQPTAAPPVAEAPRTPPEVVERQGTEGMPVEEASRVHRVSDPPPSPPLRAAQPGEGEGFVTGPRKSKIDEEREAWGLPPREPFMSAAFKEEWPLAQERNADGQAGSALVNELLEKARPLTKAELATLGHEQVRRRHELDRAMTKVNDPMASETQRELSFQDYRQAQVAYNRLADAIQNSTSIIGQSLSFVRLLADDQFNLVTLRRSEQAGVNGGKPLSPKQEEEIGGFFTRIKALRNALAAATTPKAKAQIEFELAKEITKHIARRNARIFKRLSIGGKALAASTEIMNLARAMMTTFDFSATLRQGGLVTLSHPFLASKAFKAQMEAFASERGEFEVMQGIRNDPLYAVMVADGNILHVGETTLAVELDKKQKGRDEAYQSVISGKIPIVKGFGRAYQTFMNKLRFDYYKQLVDSLSAGTAEQRNALAKWVNITTGRGGPENMGEVAGFLGAVFFAPRYIASRFQYLATPVTIWSQPKGVKRIIAKEFAKQIGGIGTVMTMFLLAKEAFDDDDEWGIEFDRRSSDFLKLRIGNTRVDMLSGLQQIMVLQKRVTTGQTKSISTGEVTDKNPWKTGSDFLRSKLSPVVGTTWDVLSGTNLINQPAGLLDMQDVPVITNWTGARAPGPFVNLFVPLVFREIVDAIEEQGAVKGTALSLATILGWAASTYQPGEPFGETEGGFGKLVREYGYGGLIKELYTRSTEEGKLLLKAFDEDKPAMFFRDETAPRLTPEEAANPRGR